MQYQTTLGILDQEKCLPRASTVESKIVLTQRLTEVD